MDQEQAGWEFPFAARRLFRDFDPYLGGTIRIVSNLAGATPIALAHNNRIKPQIVMILRADGCSPGIPQVNSSTTASVTVQFPNAIGVAPIQVVLLVA